MTGSSCISMSGGEDFSCPRRVVRPASHVQFHSKADGSSNGEAQTLRTSGHLECVIENTYPFKNGGATTFLLLGLLPLPPPPPPPPSTLPHRSSEKGRKPGLQAG